MALAPELVQNRNQISGSGDKGNDNVMTGSSAAVNAVTKDTLRKTIRKTLSGLSQEKITADSLSISNKIV